MAEERTYQGHVYRRNSAGEPWVIAGPTASRGGTIITDPYKANDELRKDEDQGFQREQLRIQQQNAGIAAQNAALATERAGRDRQTSDARGGVETTESERTAAYLATRVAGGLQTLESLGNIGAPSVFEATIGPTVPGNFAIEESRQRAINAQRDLIDAALTLGTGAAYTPEQIDSYRKSYFPQPGDKPGTVMDKQQRLKVLLEASRLKAGAAAGMIDDALARSTVLPKAPTPTGETINYSQEIPGGLTGSVTDDSDLNVTVPDDRAPDIGAYQSSQLGQGMSGVNEGIASTLGLPVDLATMGLNLVPQGINAVANTNLPTIEKPFMGGDWFKDQMDGWGIYNPNENGDGSFVRRVGQSLGSSLIPAGAASNTGRQAVAALLSGAGGGVGAATAQEVAPGNPYAEMAGEVLGGGLSGAGFAGMARNRAQRDIESAVPTVPQLKERAGELYRKAEATGAVADPTLTQDLSDTIRQLLADDGRVSPTGRVSEVYPKAKEALQLVDDYAGSPMSPRQMQTVRSVMSDGMTSPDANERRIAKLLVDGFDDWSSPLAPELAQARDVSSRYLNAEKLEQARELAGARASQFSGSGFENALRTEYRKLDRNAVQGRGRYSDEILEALQNVSRGTPGSNAARAVGRLAPTTPWNITMGTLGPAAAASYIGGPAAGLAVGTAATGLGIGGRALATQMGVRNADVAELIARNGGAIDQAPLLAPDTEKLITALLAGQSANYLED